MPNYESCLTEMCIVQAESNDPTFPNKRLETFSWITLVELKTFNTNVYDKEQLIFRFFGYYDFYGFCLMANFWSRGT